MFIALIVDMKCTGCCMFYFHTILVVLDSSISVLVNGYECLIIHFDVRMRLGLRLELTLKVFFISYENLVMLSLENLNK